MISERYYHYVKSFTGADPGLPIQQRGRQHMILPNFPKKLREIKKIWGGGSAMGAPLLRSATDSS